MPENNTQASNDAQKTNNSSDISLKMIGTDAPEKKQEASSTAPATPTPTATATKTKPAEKPVEPAKSATTEDKKEAGPITFKNIFNQKEEGPAKDTKMIKSVLSKKTQAPQVKKILGAAPTLSKDLAQEKEIKEKKKLRSLQTIFTILFLAGLVMAGFFFTQLSPSFDLFGPNLTAQLTDVNKSLRSVQTNVNKFRYLAAQLELNNFSFEADTYLAKTSKLSTVTSGTEKQLLEAGALASAEVMPQYIDNAKEYLNPGIVIETTRSKAEEEVTPQEEQTNFEQSLKEALTADRRRITSEGSLDESNREELRIIDNTLKLVGNNSLIGTIKGVNTEQLGEDLNNYIEEPDVGTRDTIQNLVSTLLGSTKSEIATIASIKTDRILWSDIIDRIAEVTEKVELEHISRGLSDVKDGIFYSGYDFETDTNKIVLSGSNKTSTGENFSIISNLIDALEDSPFFENVEMRSFAKSGSYSDGFDSTFKINLELQKDGFSEDDEPIALNSPLQKDEDGVKRS
ncbi:hypothetical protein GF340_01940 [Candidatus Peregrinibacteria bacterium]|nr:hypothetical protein [Candidatus Peregrinibacteria bacterium]